MKVTWSGIGLVGGTGKIGGSVIQNGRFGPIARRLIKPTVINTPNFNANSEKEYFRFITSQWKTLTPTQRVSWNPALPTGLSGFNYFVKANLIYYRLNNSILSLAPLAASFPSISGQIFSIDHAPPLITFDYVSAGVVTNWSFNIFLAINYSPGVALCRKSEFRLLGTVAVVIGINVFILVARIQGVATILNSNNFLKVVLVNSITGQQSAPSYYSAICT
jgi:hypothetical protein